jgi:hypothetical protein
VFGAGRRVKEHLLLRFTLAVTVKTHGEQQTKREGNQCRRRDIFRLVEAASVR